MITNGEWGGKYMERGDPGLFQGTMPALP